MALYLGNNKVSLNSGYTTTSGMKAYFNAGGKCRSSSATNFTNIIHYDDTSDLTSMDDMFMDCVRLTTIPLIDTSKVTNMGRMFYNCDELTSVPLFDTSKVTDMREMFTGCVKLTTIPLFNTSKVTSMSYMFQNCDRLSIIPALDVSNVDSMTDMFKMCSKLREIHMTGMKVSFDISASTLFTREALIEIFNNLATVTTTKYLTIGNTNVEKLTAIDLAIAEDKGWRVVGDKL